MQNGHDQPNGEAMPSAKILSFRGKRGGRQGPNRTDPMLALVEAYEAERERSNASEDMNDDRAEAHLLWLFDQLQNRTPPIYTTEGAIAALQLAAREMEHSTDGLEEPLVAAFLAFIRTGRA